MMKRSSTAYYCSIALIVLILLVMIFGKWLMPHGITPDDKINMIQYQEDGKKRYSIPPYAPNSTFLLGTDHRGFDVLSLLLNGLKYTLGTALTLILFRFVFALPWGIVERDHGQRMGHSSLHAVGRFLYACVCILVPAFSRHVLWAAARSGAEGRPALPTAVHGYFC